MKKTLTVILIILAVATAGYFVLTCAGKIERPSSLSAIFQSTPAPTPLPAYPAGSMAYMPGPGEPPVGVYANDEAEAIDELPVGAGTPAGQSVPDEESAQ